MRLQVITDLRLISEDRVLTDLAASFHVTDLTAAEQQLQVARH